MKVQISQNIVVIPSPSQIHISVPNKWSYTNCATFLNVETFFNRYYGV